MEELPPGNMVISCFFMETSRAFADLLVRWSQVISCRVSDGPDWYMSAPLTSGLKSSAKLKLCEKEYQQVANNSKNVSMKFFTAQIYLINVTRSYPVLKSIYLQPKPQMHAVVTS